MANSSLSPMGGLCPSLWNMSISLRLVACQPPLAPVANHCIIKSSMLLSHHSMLQDAQKTYISVYSLMTEGRAVNINPLPKSYT